jgi:hypothetical protein
MKVARIGQIGSAEVMLRGTPYSVYKVCLFFATPQLQPYVIHIESSAREFPENLNHAEASCLSR